jgi:hypothetical protein
MISKGSSEADCESLNKSPTTYFGKWHLNAEPKSQPQNQGFNERRAEDAPARILLSIPA